MIESLKEIGIGVVIVASAMIITMVFIEAFQALCEWIRRLVK